MSWSFPLPSCRWSLFDPVSSGRIPKTKRESHGLSPILDRRAHDSPLPPVRVRIPMSESRPEQPKIIVDPDWKAQAPGGKERLAAAGARAQKAAQGVGFDSGRRGRGSSGRGKEEEGPARSRLQGAARNTHHGRPDVHGRSPDPRLGPPGPWSMPGSHRPARRAAGKDQGNPVPRKKKTIWNQATNCECSSSS